MTKGGSFWGLVRNSGYVTTGGRSLPARMDVGGAGAAGGGGVGANDFSSTESAFWLDSCVVVILVFGS